MADYTTFEKAKKFLQNISYKDLGFSTAGELDIFIEEVIPMASRFIDRHCNRPDDFFAAGGATVTEYFNGIGTSPPADYLQYAREIELWRQRARLISLSERPVLSVTSVEELESGSWVARTKGDGSSYDYRQVGGQIYFWRNIPAEGWKNLKVVYVAGYAAIPSDIEWVCARLIANEIQAATEDRMAAVVSIGRPGLVDFEDPKIFSKDLAERLAPYQKVSMAVL